MDLFLIYLTCFGLGLVVAIISAFFADAGGHDGHVDLHAGHAEAGFDAHDMPGFSALSPTTLSSFVTAFGGFGLIFSKIEATSSPWISVPLSLIGGLAVAAGVFVLFNKIFHATQSSSEGRVGQLVGHEATIITPIATGGAGEIAYVQGGSRYTASARAEDSRTIAAGATVRIVRVVGTQFYVSND